jgi:tetratricopeptide (TPR) repeat protein
MGTMTSTAIQQVTIASGLAMVILLSCSPKKATFYHAEAARLDSLKQFAKAIKYYDKAISLDSSVADWYYQRGYAHELYGEVARGHKEAALRDYTRAIELNGDHAPAYCRRGYVRCMFSSVRDPSSDGIDDLTKSIAADSSYYLAYLYRGMFFFNYRRLEESCADYGKAAQLKPESPAARLFRQQCQ